MGSDIVGDWQVQLKSYHVQRVSEAGCHGYCLPPLFVIYIYETKLQPLNEVACYI